MMAIRAFLNGHEPDDLKDATLYSSGEPCVMCMGAIIWCGIKRLVFAASIAQLSTRIGQIDITAQADRRRGAVLADRDRRRAAVARSHAPFPDREEVATRTWGLLGRAKAAGTLVCGASLSARPTDNTGVREMRSVLLWLLGVPISVDHPDEHLPRDLSPRFSR